MAARLLKAGCHGVQGRLSRCARDSSGLIFEDTQSLRRINFISLLFVVMDR